ncbi:MAG TPA: hypothetical protein VFU18_08440 [Actinomycetota bacterium]|nr:hypothetical protein [Actinomycetota bacterium]
MPELTECHPLHHGEPEDAEAGTRNEHDARFRLKSDSDLGGFSPRARTILRAMRQYGLLLADNGSN